MNLHVICLWVCNFILMMLNVANGQSADVYIASNLVITAIMVRGQARKTQ